MRLVVPPEETEALCATFARRIEDGDVAAAVDGFYANDARSIHHPARPTQGRAALRGTWQSLVDGGLQHVRWDVGPGIQTATLWMTGRHVRTFRTADGIQETVGEAVLIFDATDDGLRCVLDVFVPHSKSHSSPQRA